MRHQLNDNSPHELPSSALRSSALNSGLRGDHCARVVKRATNGGFAWLRLSTENRVGGVLCGPACCTRLEVSELNRARCARRGCNSLGLVQARIELFGEHADLWLLQDVVVVPVQRVALQLAVDEPAPAKRGVHIETGW